eukprot:1289206-Amphidinium_carterae.1
MHWPEIIDFLEATLPVIPSEGVPAALRARFDAAGLVLWIHDVHESLALWEERLLQSCVPARMPRVRWVLLEVPVELLSEVSSGQSCSRVVQWVQQCL